MPCSLSYFSPLCKNILLLLRIQMSARIANCITSHFPEEKQNGRLFSEIPQSLSEHHSSTTQGTEGMALKF